MTHESDEHPDDSRVQFKAGRHRPPTSATGSHEPRSGDEPGLLFRVSEAASTPQMDAKRSAAKAVCARLLVRVYVERRSNPDGDNQKVAA